MKLSKLTTILSVALLCAACSPHNHKSSDSIVTLKNGTVAEFKTANHVILKSASGQLIQESYFTHPTFAEAKAQLKTMQHNLVENRQAFLTQNVHYPLRVNINGHSDFIQTPKELKQQFDKVFTPNTINAILHQDPYRLFSNAQGVTIHGGVIWFSYQGITTVNLLNTRR